MIIKPKIKGFICITTHPLGCVKSIENQISYIKSKNTNLNDNKPKNVLIIGSSTGYGLASRISLAFGNKSSTFGVYFDRPGTENKVGSPGFYNNLATEFFSKKEGLYAESYNGDAFSNETKKIVINKIKKDNIGKIDLLIYSLASPKRIDPDTGKIYKAVIKTVGEKFTSKNLNTDKEEIDTINIDPANQNEIDDTIKVMGGEDWEMWIKALKKEELLADNFKTLSYSYIGPEQTWPIYRNGTIGLAKKNLELSILNINNIINDINGKAYVSINKALVTQASSAIPVVPLYISILYKVMKDKGIHENCIEQMYRLFFDKMNKLSNNNIFNYEKIIRMDDLEMRKDVQDEIKNIWHQVNCKNLKETTDFIGYKKDFLNLFGFEINGIDYNKEINNSLLINPIESR